MEKISKKFIDKFNKYRGCFDEDFLKIKLENIFKKDKLKRVFVDYYNYNIDPDNSSYLERLLESEEEEKFLGILKKNLNIDDFVNILEKLGMDINNFEEEYFFAYVCLFFIMNRFGTIKDIGLFKNIIIMWILVDNIIDDPENQKYKKLIRNVKSFLLEEIYKKNLEEIKIFFECDSEDIILQILSEIFSQLDREKVIPFFDSCKKLFVYSYNMKKNDNGTINKSLEKSFLSIQIFLFCTGDENNITDEDYLTTCLFLQLIDDLLDLEKDRKENSETFVLNCTKQERNIIIVMLLELNSKKLSPVYKPMSFVILQILIQNRDFFDTQIHDILGEILEIDMNISNFKDTSEFYRLIKNKYLSIIK